ncbi:MAG: apolipoprotein N-acyltransferase [Frankiales bacterium]|nr:apolipoprotein N-acyltransferase [Frankiales bacterium]
MQRQGVVDPAAPPGRSADVPGRTGLTARLLAALASGLLLYLAFPPVGLWWLAAPSVALLTLACRGTSVRRGLLLGLVHGLTTFLLLVEWAATIAGPGALVALALLEASFLALLGGALAVAGRATLWPLWAAALWVLQEALRARLPFGGFPWGRLAFSQGESPLLPLAALGGAPLLGFVVALLAGALAWAAVRRTRVAAAVAAVSVLTTLGVAVLVPVPTDGAPVRVAVVQGNVPRLGLDFNDQRAAVLTNHVDATHALAADVRAGRAERPDLVVWPENASDLDPFTDPDAFDLIDGAVKDVGVPVLVGAVLDGPGDQVSNAGIVWDPVTGPGERYVKRHPVPFGEYVPLRSLVRRVTSKVDLVPRDFAKGTTVGVLDVGPVRLGDVICFEVAYDDLVRDVVTAGGRLLVVQTNNATFGRSGETVQQLAMGRLRAVEHGRAVLVSATSGISAVIRPDGSLQASAPVFTREVLQAEVPTRSGTTLATRLGALPELALSLLALLGLVLAARRPVTA